MGRDRIGDSGGERSRVATVVRRFEPVTRRDLGIPIAVAVTFFIVLVLALYPGVYSPDSVVMLSEGIGVTPMNNWHPVLLAELWGVVVAISGSNAGVWVAQSMLAAICAFALLRQVRRRAAVVAAVVGLLLPPLWGALAMTWKDTQLALVWWLVAIAMVRPTMSRRWAAGLLVGVLGISIARYNSIGLAIGPAWLASTALITGGTGSRYRLPAIRIAATVFALGAAVLLSVGLGGTRVEDEVHPEEALYVFDIVGVAVRTGDVGLRREAEATPPCTFDVLRTQYQPSTAAYLIFGPEACVNVGLPIPDDGIQHVFVGDWIDAVTAHPTAYLRHRTGAALITAGITERPLGTLIVVGDPAAESLLSPTLLARTAPTVAFLDWFPQHLGVLYRPIVWVLATAVAIGFAGRRRSRLGVVFGSTIVNLLIVCLTTPAAQVRYSYPALITMIVAIVISLDDRSDLPSDRLAAATVDGSE